MILGIETSCDETAAAVVEGASVIRSSIVSSQVKWHQRFGGVVPEIASRKHLENLNWVIERALTEAGVTFGDLSAVAVTLGPGLIGALLVGVAAAKALTFALGLPLLGVNHLVAHVWAARLENPDLKPPFLALVISGGHTSLIEVKRDFYCLRGETLDDAAGEAFDKIAKFLNLGYPGGPIIEEEAAKGNPQAISFPRAFLKDKGNEFNFSFSGLKTAVVYFVKKEGKERVSVRDICASFQAALFEVVTKKTLSLAKKLGYKKIVVAGGVAVNQSLRTTLKNEAGTEFELYFPSVSLCTDNAAMVAAAGFEKLFRRDFLNLEVEPSANFDLNG